MFRKFIKNNKGFTLTEIMITVAVIGVVSSLAVPNMIKARESAQTQTCISNLRKIDDAKSMWATFEGELETSVPDWSDLVPDYIKRTPECPASGTYDIGQVREFTICDQEGHELD